MTLFSRSFPESDPRSGQGSASRTFRVTGTTTTAPTITNNTPTDQTTTTGQNVTFAVTTTGNPAPNFQWQILTPNATQWANLAGQTGSTLTLSNVQPVMNGNRYRVRVSNAAGVVYSRGALLTVGAQMVTITWNAGPGGHVANPTQQFASNTQFDQLQTPTRPGFTFEGWWRTVDGIERLITPTSIVPTYAATITARWSATPITIHLNANGGLVSPTSTIRVPGTAMGDLPRPVWSFQGVEFLGWWTTPRTGGLPITSATIVPTQDMRIYARWDFINVRSYLYGRNPANFSRYSNYARGAAHSFMATFGIDISVAMTVQVNPPRRAFCPLHATDNPYRYCCPDTFFRLRDFYEVNDLRDYLLSRRISTTGLHTLFVEGYMYNEGCDSQILGMASSADPNNTLVSSSTLPVMGFPNPSIPMRTLQHEWSHSYGIFFEPANTSPCLEPCIMMGAWSNDSSSRGDVWCTRCRNIIHSHRSSW